MIQNEATIGIMWVLAQVIDAVGIEQRSTALDAVDFISFLEQEFGKVGAILTSDAGD